MEGVSSILAGLWGTGVGSTTLTENVHTIAVTKMGSRRAVELGAFILILLSFVGKESYYPGCLYFFSENCVEYYYILGWILTIKCQLCSSYVKVFFAIFLSHSSNIQLFCMYSGKVGGFIASIPDVMVAGLLCFMWAMLAAMGLSNLRYSETGSSRNNIIVGLSLFFSLSIPAYFQQYGLTPNANSSVPSYFQPYIVASHGPFRTGYGGVCDQISFNSWCFKGYPLLMLVFLLKEGYLDYTTWNVEKSECKYSATIYCWACSFQLSKCHLVSLDII